MLLKASLAFFLVLFETVNNAPLGKQKADDVLISFQCIHININGGPQAKEPVLLIHGLGQSKSNWDGVYQLIAVQTGRRVCAIDLRNHGSSSWNDKADLDSMTSDIAEFLDSMKIQKVNLIGHSLGGKIAVHYTLNNPLRVASIVVEDMRPNGIVPEALKDVKLFLSILKAAIEKVPKGSNIDEAKKIVADFINEELKKLGVERRIDEYTVNTLPIRCSDDKCEWTVNINALEKGLMDPEALIESRGLYGGPALFIYGTKSPFKVGEDKENILKLFPKAKLIPVKGAGHVIHGLHREFDDEVIRFLNSQ